MIGDQVSNIILSTYSEKLTNLAVTSGKRVALLSD